ncbi:MAG TPA: CHASE2 domain-containing protein, partial [Gemmatimonadales bacterium]|nr:CHASE2 domain-containing protein [Gemmatimonadales bacterium]
MTQRTRRISLVLTTGLLIALVLAALRGSYVMQALELKTLDFRFRALHDPARADTSVVIFDVDDLSLDLLRSAVGRWPWPRDVWAMVLQYASAAGARVVAFDITFPDPDLANPGADSAFAAAVASAGFVVHALSFQRVHDSAAVSRLARFREDTAALALLASRFSLPVESLPAGENAFELAQHPVRPVLAGARAAGSVNFTPDPVDGTARRVPLLYQFRGAVFPALGLAAALAADSARLLGCGRAPVWSQSALRLCDVAVPLDRGTMLVNWKGPYRDPARRRETYRIYPVAQILNSFEQLSRGETPEVPLEALRGKVVFVGASGAGLFEARANPFGPAEPGVLIHATVTDNLLRGDFLTRASPPANLAALLLTSLLAAAAVALLSSAAAAGAAGLGIAAAYL